MSGWWWRLIPTIYNRRLFLWLVWLWAAPMRLVGRVLFLDVEFQLRLTTNTGIRQTITGDWPQMRDDLERWMASVEAP